MRLRHYLCLVAWLVPVIAAPPEIRVLFYDFPAAYPGFIPFATRWAAQNNITLTLDFAQTNVTTDYAAVITSHLKNPKPDSYDIYMLDVIWPGDYVNYLLPLDSYLDKTTLDQHNPDILVNDRVNGHYVALPFYADYGLFFYRKDLLEKYNRPFPQTWDEMEQTAGIILRGERQAGNNNLTGLSTQLDAYESLTCNVAEWTKSVGGGTIMDVNGRMTMNNEHTAWILNKMRSWINDDPWIIPTGSLVYRENSSLDKFASGNAIFMRGWPYAIQYLAQGAPEFNNTGRTFG
ncbi:hypothetical protein HK104_000863, partial [Borealophlyctis nickersoniae]